MLYEERVVVFGEEEEAKEPDEGTQDFFVKQYNEKVETLTGTFLFDNMKGILAQNNLKEEEKLMQLVNLIGVYYAARTEFEKHENKLKIHR